MLRIELAFHEARDRQAALRRHAGPRRRWSRPHAARRFVGAWIVRLGRVVAGRPATIARVA